MDFAPAISVSHVPTYAPDMVRGGLREVLAPLGGIGAFVGRGDVVLLKPNFLVARAVQKAVCTHPQVILAMAEMALDAGAAEVLVGDSPAFGSCAGVVRKLGLADELKERGVQIAGFNEPVEAIHPDPGRYRRFEVDRSILEVDKIINLVKIKTHGQMFMTLAVKNTFGYVVGTRKAAWHLEAGREEELFATMLLDLHYFRAPVLHVADGIEMMEGNGPGAGKVRELGLLFAARDAVAMDRAICDVLSVPHSHVPTLRVAEREGYGVKADQAVDWFGPALSDIRVDAIEHPRIQHVSGLITNRPLLRFSRRLIEVRPVVKKKACVGCRICQQQCPAEAISMVGKRDGSLVAKIHPRLCIHCYCCQEICPEGAIVPRRGIVRSLMRRPESGEA